MPRKGKRAASLGVRKKGNRHGKNRDDDVVVFDDDLPPLSAPYDSDSDDNDDDDLTVEPSNVSYTELCNAAFDEIADFPLIDKEVVRRLAVAYQFIHVHGCPSSTEWNGRDGTIALIKNTLAIPNGTCIHYILEDIVFCESKGIQYTGHRQLGPKRQVKIDVDDAEAQIVADALEDGFSLMQATRLVNLHREDNELEPLSYSAVYHLSKRLCPVITPVRKQKQGSRDADSPWARARFRWVTQLLLRLGKTDHLERMDLLKDPDGSLPSCFDPALLEEHQFSLQDVAWWDETHRQCAIGCESVQAGRKFQLRFLRDANGKLDPNGTVTGNEKVLLKVKYDKEVRMCLGCAHLGDHGVVLAPFDYSGKLLISIKDLKAKQALEMKRVQGLKAGKGSGWIHSRREADTLYCDDPITMMTGVGGKTADFFSKHGIKTIGDLGCLDHESLIPMVEANMPLKKLLSLQMIASCALTDNAPTDIDYRKAANPYKARYGDEWESKINASSQLSSYICITEMVQHIYDESARIFAGKKGNWYFYHDALSLMTAKATIDWMKEKGIYKHWLLPVLGLNTEPDLKGHYSTAPPGNSPELMPWDASLNKDFNDAIDWHILATSHYSDSDPRKFLFTTPAKGSIAAKRVLEGAPPSERVMQDVEKVVTSLEAIHCAQGTVIQGLGDRSGKRKAESMAALERAGKKLSMKGGKQPRNPNAKLYKASGWLHPDAQEGPATKIEASLAVSQKAKNEAEALCEAKL